MRNITENKRGQFVIIAVLLVAIMIVSVGALLYDTASYYKNEPWQEYSALIGDIELNSQRLLELSLTNYTQTSDPNVLKENLNKWQLDLLRLYPSMGIALDFALANGQANMYGISLHFSEGLANVSREPVSASSARASFTLNISSIGLYGYKFNSEASLKLRIDRSEAYDSNTNMTVVAVNCEKNLPITGLTKNNFMVNGEPVIKVTSHYDAAQGLTFYSIFYTNAMPSEVQVWDQRGICVTGYSPNISTPSH